MIQLNIKSQMTTHIAYTVPVNSNSSYRYMIMFSVLATKTNTLKLRFMSDKRQIKEPSDQVNSKLPIQIIG